MRITYLLTVFYLLIQTRVSAQVPSNNETEFETSPEKIYQHWDREWYTAGQTAWFKVYVFSDHQFSRQSTVLYTDLLNPEGQLIKRVVSPIIDGVSQGQFQLADSLANGFYTARAFTPLMLNYGKRFVFEKRILITADGVRLAPLNSSASIQDIKVSFYPESGHFITGQFNSVAFRALSASGQPVELKGSIVDDQNEIYNSAITFHQGMGSFDLRPLEGRSYFLIVDSGSIKYRFPLPVHKPEGLLFKVRYHSQGFVFELTDFTGNSNARPATIIGQMQGRTLFKLDIPDGKKSMSGVIRTASESIRTGIMNITVQDRYHRVLAERLVFVNRQEHQLDASLETDTLSFEPRSLNSFTLKFKEAVNGNFSISVTDAENDRVTESSFSAKSYLLLCSDLPAYVDDPDWYFKTSKDSASFGLDQLMMINGWKRYQWEQSIQSSVPAKKYSDPGYISIKGSIRNSQMIKEARERKIMLLMSGPNFPKRVEFPTFDSVGNFKLDSLIFFGKPAVGFIDFATKKSKPVAFSLSPGNLSLTQEPGFFKDWVSSRLSHLPGTEGKDAFIAYQPGTRDSVKQLKEIVIKGKKKTPSESVNDEYTSGFFSTGETRIYDLVNESGFVMNDNIMEYLKFRIPGLTVMNDPNEGYGIYYRQQATLSSMGNVPMVVYLNENLSDAAELSTIPANQVALVKFFNYLAIAPGNGSGGVLAVYTRKMDNQQTKKDIITTDGFTPVLYFQHPRYDQATQTFDSPDPRRTLFWIPELLVSQKEKGIPIRFNNNDKAKQYHIRIEGMTTDGRYLLIDKFIRHK